ncbi:MAG TPA: hypothetical protein VGR71_06975 [Nitrospira sp.]|nr:hypothetical protein [Nitrospira sp.]
MRATFFGGGEGGFCVLWDIQEHADVAAAVIGPKLQEHFERVIGQPDIRLFPVIAS